jgi:hypothetical protein
MTMRVLLLSLYLVASNTSALAYVPYANSSYYAYEARKLLNLNVNPGTEQSGNRRSVRIGNIEVPEGGRVVCMLSSERPAKVKRCADGSSIYSTRPTMCDSSKEYIDIQVSTQAPTAADLKAIQHTHLGGQRCYIMLPPEKTD